MMTEMQRQHYLHLMGIPVWQPRYVLSDRSCFISTLIIEDRPIASLIAQSSGDTREAAIMEKISLALFDVMLPIDQALLSEMSMTLSASIVCCLGLDPARWVCADARLSGEVGQRGVQNQQQHWCEHTLLDMLNKTELKATVWRKLQEVKIQIQEYQGGQSKQEAHTHDGGT